MVYTRTISAVCRWKILIQLFFFLFPFFSFCFRCLFLCCKCCYWQLWFIFLCFLVCFSCIDALMQSPVLADLIPSLLDTYCLCYLSCIVMNFPFVWVPSRSKLSYKGDYSSVYSVSDISTAEFRFKKFSCSFEVLLSDFILSLCSFNSVQFRYSYVLVIFFFSRNSGSFLLY